MSITFDSKFVYIMGISGAYTHEEAKEIIAKLSEVVNAAQQSVQSDGATPWACECDWVNDANNIQCVACGTPRR